MQLKFVFFTTLLAITNLQMSCSSDEHNGLRQLTKSIERTATALKCTLEPASMKGTLGISGAATFGFENPTTGVFKLNDDEQKEMDEFASSLRHNKLVAVSYPRDPDLYIRTNVLKKLFEKGSSWSPWLFSDCLRYIHLNTVRRGVDEVMEIEVDDCGVYTTNTRAPFHRSKKDQISMWLDYFNSKLRYAPLWKKRVLFIHYNKSLLFLDSVCVALQQPLVQIFGEPEPNAESSISHTVYCNEIYEPTPNPLKILPR